MKTVSIFFSLLFGYINSAIHCNVTPIEVWGGSPSSRTELLPVPVNLVIVQHTVTDECTTDEECIVVLKKIRRDHINRGFTDIANSFFFGGNGKVYEGAGWRIGAHTRRFNDRAISISFIGDFREKLPTPEALKAAQDFLSCSMKKYLSEEYKLVGHFQLAATVSPGATLQSHIETWPHWTSDISQL